MSPRASIGVGPSFRVEKPEVPPIILEPRRSQGRDDASHLELMIRFTAWSYQLHRFPSVAQIEAAFEVSRATAYRWRNALAAAHGIDTPPNVDEDELL